MIAAAWMLIDFGSYWADHRQLRIVLLPAVFISVGVISATLLAFRATRNTQRQEAQHAGQSTYSQEIAAITPGTSIYVLSTGIPPFQIFLTHHLTWASRYGHLWMLPAIVMNENSAPVVGRPFKRISPARVSALDDEVHQEVSEDISYWKPQFIFVKHTAPGALSESDTLRWFLRDIRFSQEWSHYRRVKMVVSYDDPAQENLDEYIRVEN